MRAVISVVMPLYNAAMFLPRALDSIIAQSFTDWELLAVCEPDSADGTNAIIAEYATKDPRIKQIINPARIGISESLNAGIRASGGEYIARMDCDDVCLPRRFEKQIQFLENHPDISILGSNIQFIDNNGRPGAHISNYPLEHERIKADLLFYCNIMHPAVMLRKADIEKHQLYYNGSFTASEDFELWNRAKHIVRLANMPEILLYYRWRMSTATRGNAEAGDRNYIAVIDRSCHELGLEFTRNESRLLYPRTCDMSLSNAGYVKQTLENAARRITEANDKLGIYQRDALASTLNKRLYWKRHPIRSLTAAVIRSVGGNRAVSNGLAGYLEQRGFEMTLRRAMRLR
jgi:glycosyltransferase involved in cell wall biosynthesis